jgi:hypothetical protein
MYNAHRHIAKGTYDELAMDFVADAQNTAGLSLTVPSNVNAGDLAIAYSSTATGPSPTVYSGFTQIASLNSTFEDMFQYKIMTDADLGATFTRTNDSYDVAMMIFYRAVKGSFTSVTVSDINNAGQTSGIPADQTVDVGYPSVVVFVSGCYGSSYSNDGDILSGNTPLSSYGNIRAIGENGNQIRMYHFENNTIARPYTISINGDFGNYNRLMSCGFTFT